MNFFEKPKNVPKFAEKRPVKGADLGESWNFGDKIEVKTFKEVKRVV